VIAHTRHIGRLAKISDVSILRADECERSVRDAVASGNDDATTPDIFPNNSNDRLANTLRSTLSNRRESVEDGSGDQAAAPLNAAARTTRGD
jgi:hypothetical protein